MEESCTRGMFKFLVLALTVSPDGGKEGGMEFGWHFYAYIDKTLVKFLRYKVMYTNGNS
jgi:hypothetical protein